MALAFTPGGVLRAAFVQPRGVAALMSGSTRWPPPTLSADALSWLADELASVAKLLVDEPILARHLAEATR